MKAFLFKNQQDRDDVLDRNRRERAEEEPGAVSAHPQRGVLAVRAYWIVPKDTIPGSEDDETPGVGEAYIYRLNRDLETPKLERRQFRDEDVVVTVYNYSQNAIKQNPDNEHLPKLRATEDTFGELSLVDQGDVIVRMEKTGGENGSESAENTYAYDVFTVAGTLIESNVSLASNSRHEFKTQELGEIDPATRGNAFWNEDGKIVIYDCNERPRVGPCKDADGGGGDGGGGGGETCTDGTIDVNKMMNCMDISLTAPADGDIIETSVTIDGVTKQYTLPASGGIIMRHGTGTVSLEYRVYRNGTVYRNSTFTF